MKPGEATRQIYSTGIKSISELACDFSLLQQAVVLPLLAKASVLGAQVGTCLCKHVPRRQPVPPF